MLYYIHIVLSLSPLLQYGHTSLMRAAYYGHEDTVKELLSAGASPLCTNNVSTCTLYSTCCVVILNKQLYMYCTPIPLTVVND